MKVLLLGSGGREHALAWKMSQSVQLEKLYVAPGNAGTAEVAENVALSVTDFGAIADFIIERDIDLLVVGPEDPLVRGIRNELEGQERFSSLMIVGPGREGARLEGSKDFAKAFMMRQGIPTARYMTVTKENLAEGVAFLSELQSPYVLKADGLAAGKGVLILESREEAEQELNLMLSGKFGAAGEQVVIEEFLKGIELSVFVLTDGKDYKILGSAKDYKRIGEGDTGLNTGGMGAVSPVPFAGEEFNRKVEEQIIRPTIRGLQEEGIPYQGFIFFGLMNVEGDPYVIEYNVRMGDPETETVFPRITTDVLTLFQAMAQGALKDAPFELDARYCTAVVLVAEGYPGNYEKGKEISGFEGVEDSLVFHAGTRKEQDKVLTNGGRVLVVSSFGTTLEEALQCSYRSAKHISYAGKYFRRDIGQDLK